MSTVRNALVTTLVVLSSGFSLSAFAQTPAPSPQYMPGQPGAMGMQPHMQGAHAGNGGQGMMNDAKRESRRAERHQKHLNEMKVFLQLQPAQEAAWNSFETAMKSPMKRPVTPSPADIEKMSTPERIDKMMALKAERDTEITKRMNASKTFYAALTPAQQKVFDMHTQKFLTSPAGPHGKMHP